MNLNKLFLILTMVASVVSAYALRTTGTRILSIADGLPSNEMSVALQAPDGYLWIGTGNGLGRYDGYSFVNFYGNEFYATNRMNIAQPDWSNGLLWVSSGKGQLGCFDIDRQQFVDYTGKGQTADIYWGTTFGKGICWQFSADNGARCITIKEKTFKMKEYNTANGLLPSNWVYDVKIDDDGNSWILTKKGLVCVAPDGGKRFTIRGDDFVCVNVCGRLVMLLSRRQGFVELNRKGNVLHRCAAETPIPNKLTGNTIIGTQWLILSERGMTAYDFKRHSAIRLGSDTYIPNGKVVGKNSRAVFIGNDYGVLYRYDVDGNVKRMELIPSHIIMLTHRDHFEIATTKNGLEYISTFGSGLFVYNPNTATLRHCGGEDYLVNVLADNADRIWTLIDRTGMALMNTDLPKCEHIQLNPSASDPDANSVRAFSVSRDGIVTAADMQGYVYECGRGIASKYKNKVYAMFTDSKGQTWIGTRGGGLWLEGKGLVEAFPCGNVYDIIESTDRRLWVATSDGLVVTDGNGGFRHCLKGTFVHDLELDGEGNVWVASEDGLFIVTPNRTLQFSKRRRTFPTNDVICLRRGRSGGMMAGTVGSGIVFCSLGKKTLRYRTITTDNGLTSNVVKAIEVDNRGRVWAATEEGLSCIMGNEVKKLYLAEDISGNSYNENASMVNDDGTLWFGTRKGIAVIHPDEIDFGARSQDIAITGIYVNGQHRFNATSSLELDYNQNTVSISFSDFAFDDVKSSNYVYRLDGVDRDWSVPTNSNSVAYANLRPGKYTFRVKAVGGERQAEIAIVISHPWWDSPWAWIAYALTLAVVAVAIITVNRKIRKAKTDLEVERKTTEIKMNFFTNIANELRTPLSLVYGASEKLKENGQKTTLQALRNGTRRLMRTARQLSLFRELNLGRVALTVENGDIVSFLRYISDEYRAMAADRSLGVAFVPFASSLVMPFDHEKMELIVCGMLSDALGKCPKGKGLTIRLRRDNAHACISVEGDGCSFGNNQGESYTDGIGMYVSRRMAAIHHGTLRCTQDAYTLSLPCTEQDYRPTEWAKKITQSVGHTENVETEVHGEPYNEWKVQIVERDHDMAAMMKNHLGKYFNVECTDDYNAAVSIDCDVMIIDNDPADSAYATIKATKQTDGNSDAAIIVLTNSDDVAEKLKAINSGADATLSKPVSLEILLAMVAKHARRDNAARTTNTVIVSDVDIKFKRELEIKIAQHVADADFSVAKLSELMHYSSSQLNSKVKRLTGKTPLELLRSERMKYAARQLVETRVTVEELCGRLGYTSTSRFYNHFRQQFGCSPAQYRKSNP